MEPEDERFRLLFDQICRMLTQPSSFNLSLPEQFRTTAFRYLEGDAHTVAHMKAVENRHFMLSDLFDYIHLVKTMGGSWISAGGSPFHWLHDGLSNVEACLWIMMILDPVEPKS